MGDLDLERENERRRTRSGDVDLDLPDRPYLSGDRPLILELLDCGDLERKRRFPAAFGWPPCGGLIGLSKFMNINQ